MVIMTEGPFMHRKRVRRLPQVKKSELIGYTNNRWPQAEETVLREIQGKDQSSISAVCLKYMLNPADFCDKWLKLLRTLNPDALLDLLHRCKEGYKAGLSFPDIGRTVKLRRGSVKNILKGHVSLENVVCPRANQSIGVPECFRLSLFSRPNVVPEQELKDGIVQQFTYYRDSRIEQWMGEDSELLLPRTAQIFMLKHLALYGTGQILPACAALHISESVFEELWGPLLSEFGPVRLEALVKIVIQLLLMGYPAPTITYKMCLDEAIVREVSFNFGVEDDDQELMLASFFHLLQVETDLKTLCEACNLPLVTAKRLKERFVRTQELSGGSDEKSAWWLYQNGIDVCVIEAWTQHPFERSLRR